MTKIEAIRKKIPENRPEKEAIFNRSRAELRRFLDYNKLTISEGAALLGISHEVLRSLINVMDAYRLPRPEYLSRWATQQFSTDLITDKKGHVINVHYILTGERLTPREKQLLEKVKELEALISLKEYGKI